MDVTLRQLKYLISLAKHRHFGNAAAAVSVSQPALSVQIKALEDTLGVLLIERGAREVIVTPIGQEVLRRAKQIEREVRELSEAARWQHGLSGRLRMGVIPTIAPYLIPVALPLLRNRDVELDLGVREARTEQLISELREGELDVLVVALPIEDRGLECLPLFDDFFLLGGSERAISECEDALQPDLLEPERLLLLDDGHCLADQALAACSLRRDETRMDLRASSLSTLCRLAVAEIGMTLVPELAVRAEHAAARGLALRRFSGAEPKRQIGLVRRKCSTESGWFAELASILARAGQLELSHTRRAYPLRQAQIPHDINARAG
ncbi:MAG: LysR substrate-binding domain-containing protein [Pseudomonadota bacterium]